MLEWHFYQLKPLTETYRNQEGKMIALYSDSKSRHIFSLVALVTGSNISLQKPV